MISWKGSLHRGLTSDGWKGRGHFIQGCVSGRSVMMRRRAGVYFKSAYEGPGVSHAEMSEWKQQRERAGS